MVHVKLQQTLQLIEEIKLCTTCYGETSIVKTLHKLANNMYLLFLILISVGV